MSEVFVVIVDEVKRKIFVGKVHYRLLRKIGRGELYKDLEAFDLDEGYLMIDKRKKVLVNAQKACNVWAKGFDVFTIY